MVLFFFKDEASIKLPMVQCTLHLCIYRKQLLDSVGYKEKEKEGIKLGRGYGGFGEK